MPSVQTCLAAWGVRQAASALSLDVTAERMSYNLLTLTGRLEGVRAAALTDSTPFAAIDDVSVDLSWKALLGRVEVEAIEATGLRLTLVRRADGSLNLPAIQRSSSRGSVGFPVGRLRLRDADLSYQDLGRRWGVSLAGLELDLEPSAAGAISGRLHAQHGPLVRASAFETSATSLQGFITYDGSSVALERLRYDAREGSLEVGGRLTSLWSAPTFDLDVSGRLALPEISSTLSLDPSVSGTLRLQGSITGPLAAPVALISIDGDQLSWRHVGPASLRARSTVDASDLIVDAATITLEQGSITGRGRFTFHSAAADAGLAWHALPARSILGPFAPSWTAAGLSGTAQLSWKASDGLAGLQLHAENRSLPMPLPPDAVTLDGTLSFELVDRRWELRHRHEIGGGVVVAGDLSGHLAGLDLASGQLNGSVAVSAKELPRAMSLVTALGFAPPEWGWPRRGRLDARFSVKGTVTAPLLVGDAAIEDLEVAEAGVIRASSSIALSQDRIAIEQLEASIGPNQAVASGTWDLRTQVVRAQVAVDLIDPAKLAPVVSRRWPLAGKLSGSFDVTGVASDPIVQGRIEGHDLTIARQTVQDLSARITFDSGLIAVSDLEARQSEGGELVGNAEYRVESGAYNLRADATGISIQPLVQAENSPSIAVLLSARLSGRGLVEDFAGADLEVDLRALDVRAGDGELHLAEPASLRYANRSMAVGQLRLQTGSSLLEASGEVGGTGIVQSLETSLRGDLADLAPWLLAVGLQQDVILTGTLAADLRATGSLDRPVLTGRALVENGAARLPEYPELRAISVTANLSDGIIDVDRLAASFGDITLDGNLRVPLGLLSQWLPEGVTTTLQTKESAASFSGRVEGLTTAALASLLGREIDETLEGEAAVAIELEAEELSLERVRGTATMDRLMVRAAGLPVTQVRPTQIVIADGHLRIADWLWEAAGNRVSIQGQAALTADRNLDLRVAGQVDARVLGVFLPQVATGGVADVLVSVGGTLTVPLVDGTVAIREGEIRMADPQTVMSDLNGRLQLAGQQLRIVELGGTLNGGPFTATGELHHEGFSVTRGGLTLTGTDIALNVPQGMRTNVDADVSLSVSVDRMLLSGRVIVQRGAYREPLSLAAGLASAARGAMASLEPARPSMLDGIELDVAVASSDDLIVDNNYGRMDLALDVRLVGTVSRPSIVGRAAIREGGVLYLGGRTYQIESGTIDFTNPRALAPELDLTARTRIAEYDITITLEGTPETVRATLSSDPMPPLGQPDIVSLLATGRLADQVGGAGTQVAREQLLGYLSGEALGFAARTIGVDALRLERGATVDQLQSDQSLIAGEVDPASRLTVSKAFSRYVDVVLSQNLREGGRLTWIVTFNPRRDLEFRAVSRDDRSRAYEARHSVSFGRAERAPAATAVPRMVSDERVVAVRFVRVPGSSERELRRMLALGAGDRFDFYRWQQDRERLRRFYLDRGYLEVRVSARRLDQAAPGGAPGITLLYEIDSGPPTTLEIEGYLVPARVVRELETLWSNAVFDEALFADLERAVRLWMVGDGFLRARVTASLPPPAAAGEKRIRITIVPGERTPRHDIVFEGHRQISTERLEALISEDAQRLAAWLDPAALAREVIALYRAEGLLAARVAAGPIDFSDNGAVLPVRIDEGSPFSVSRVLIAGTTTRREDEMRRTFGVQVGSRYLPDDVERGRRELEADYAQRGFNAMRSTVDTRADVESATVEVRLTVEEGPQQILDGVVIEGGRGVRPETIANALGLEPGTPVDMDGWFQARRRLLDTGLFRRVDIDAVPLAAAVSGREPMAARVSLERHPVWRLRYGLAVTDAAAPVGEDRDFRGGLTADLQHRGLFGRPGTFGGIGRASTDQRVARTFLTLPSFFGLPLTSSLFAASSRRRIVEPGFLTFVSDKVSFTAEQRFRPASHTQVSYGYQFERNHAFDPDRDPDDPLALDFNLSAARLTSTVTVDTRDDPFDATRGLFHSSSVEYAPKALGSDLRFLKYFVQQFFYVPIGGPLVSASAFRLGMGRGFGQELVVLERFFAGGGNTVRGYRDNALGGRDFLGEPAGGEAELILNQEIRFPIFRWLRGVGFLDAGNIFKKVREMSLTDLAVGAGGGLRLATPVGLFRLDVGVPLSRAERPRRARWHLSFGQMF